MALESAEINHVQITVLQTAEEDCKKFYGEILGFKEIAKPENLKKRGGAWYQINGIELHLSIEEHAANNETSKRHICYVVPNLVETQEQLEKRGVEIIPDNQPVPEWVRFYVRDPGGNRIEIAQRVEFGP